MFKSKSSKYFDEKVASHNKKQNKQAKKNNGGGKMKKFRKDPGVPNSAPFKQQVLKDAASFKQRVCLI